MAYEGRYICFDTVCKFTVGTISNVGSFTIVPDKSFFGIGNRAIANTKKGFIWDYCKRANVTYRTYGEFADGVKANIPSLVGHLCPYYTGWDLAVRDTTRFYQWQHEFDSMVAIN